MTSFQVVIQTLIYLCLFATSIAYLKPRKRIVNGKRVTDFSHPYIASIHIKESGRWIHNCGGVLIAQNKVLTAAHCLNGKHFTGIRVEVGFLDQLGRPNKFQQTLSVSFFAVHEKYKKHQNDIAVIHLSGEIVLNKGVQIATLAPRGSSFVNTKCIMAGWGKKSNDSRISAKLIEVEAPVIPNSQCKITYSDIGAKHICAYDASVASSLRPSGCFGDSGGPLMCGSNFQYVAGIVSFGSEECYGDYPSVFTRVSEYLDWIASH